ncbi:IS110 family transposase [Thermodesulfobacteriota bacterium]
MEKHKEDVRSGEETFVGIDLHKRTWHVTIRSSEIELFSGSIPSNWQTLCGLLDRYRDTRIQVVYEAGHFGLWLYDCLIEYGVECIVTAPSLLPQEYGNRVKTDRRDSRKLAHFLAKGMLKRVWVPSKEERFHRQVARRRRQLVEDRVRTQNRIKSELQLYGIYLDEPKGKWSRTYLESLHGIQFKDPWMQESFKRLLEQYEFLSELVEKQTKLLKELSETELYRERMGILKSVPGIGLIIGMEILLELQDVSRFRRAEQLAAYVGLTPSQYSSADKIRMGRITGIGKSSLRSALVEASWRLIRKDGAMREKYERIKARAGAKRAIVAIARTLLLRTRRMLLDGRPYILGVVA